MDITGTPLHEFFNVFWNFIKKHAETDPVNGSQEEVEIFKSDVEAIQIKYKSNPPLHKFAVTCMIAYLTYLEETNGKTMRNLQ